MTSPRMTAKEKADRGPIAAYFRTNDTHPTGRLRIGGDRAADSRAPWTIDGWKTSPTCAIVGPCLTGAHATPDPEPAP